MTSDVSLRIPTSSLRALLGDKPDLLMQIESMACEKIAEEIVRKTIRRDLDKMASDVQRLVDGELFKRGSSWGSSPQLTDRQKKIVADAVNEALRKAIEERINSTVDQMESSIGVRLQERLARRHEEWEAAIKKDLDARDAAARREIRELARSEFLSVVTDVRQALGQ